MKVKYILGVLSIIACMLSTSAYSAKILFGAVGGGYLANGQGISNYLNTEHDVDYVRLDLTSLAAINGGQGLSVYDQVWVYDLTLGSNNSGMQVDNYNEIASWFDASAQDLILDGRIISSNYVGKTEPDWIRNYANELDQRSGGLVLGTDHASPNQDYGVFVDGINTINDILNIDRFHDRYYSYPLEAIVDTNSPLYSDTATFACSFDATQRCINDHSSTSYVATGQQGNLDINLTPVAYHGNISPGDFSNAYNFAAVSTTMGSITFGTCGNPGQPPCDGQVPEPSILALMAAGFVGLGFVRRRKQQS